MSDNYVVINPKLEYGQEFLLELDKGNELVKLLLEASIVTVDYDKQVRVVDAIRSINCSFINKLAITKE